MKTTLIKIIKTVKLLLIILLIIGINGCNSVNIKSGKEKLPIVASLTPPKLPNWIEQISPLGEANTLSQIRIIFKEPLIPIEKLDTPQQELLLNKFTIWPPLPGKFRFLTPRMVGFQADQAIPQATRIEVTLKAGLSDLKNNRLNQDIAWTFNTQPIKITNLPGVNPVEKSEMAPIELQPKLQFTANTELDIESVKKHLQLIADDQKQVVNFHVKLDKSEAVVNEDPLQKFAPATKEWIYNITPQETLRKATNYRLTFSPGILPGHGNLASSQEFVSKLSTYAPLKFEGIKPYGEPDASGTYGRFVKGSPSLQFNNILVTDSIKDHIKISPQAKNIDPENILQIYDQDRIVRINPYALEPNQNYQITIDSNIKDQFGQTLGRPITIQYHTSDIAGNIAVPADFNIFPSNQNLQLNIEAINLPESKYKAAYRIIKPSDLVYSNNADELLPKPEKWTSFSIKYQKNKPVNIAISLKEKLKNNQGMLAYGIQARTHKYLDDGKQIWHEPTTYGMVQLTNLGVFAQWFPKLGLIRVHHLSDGTAVKGANIAIYQSKLYQDQKSRSQPLPCATGKTNDQGILQIESNQLNQCYTKSQYDDYPLPKLLVIAQENQDWAFTRTQEYSGAYDYGIDAGWESDKPASRGVIFSDRKLYQPGEKAAFTGFTNYLSAGKIQQDKNTTYQISLVAPNGKTTDLGTKTTNEYSTFSLDYLIPKNQPLGYYTITAKSKNGQEISGEIRVAEFKPPNFKVDLQLNKKFAFVGDQITANVASNYLFGPGVEGGKAKYFITRQKTDFIPENWQEFSFGRQWFWPEESPNITTDVLQTSSQLDANGKSSQNFTVDKDLPYPMSYRVDVQVSDVSNLSVANNQSFTALPSNKFIGLKSNFVADAGKEFPIEIIVTDLNGKPLANQRINIELQQMKYTTVTQVIEGSKTPKNQVEYQTVSKTEITSSNIPQTVKLTPTVSGSYRIRANFSDSIQEITATDLQIWVTGENQVFWGVNEKDKLLVKLDKKEFKVGETATALIQSPYTEGELYFAVIKDKPLYQKVVKVSGGAPQIQFTVTPEMLPNAAVEAVLVRQGKPINQLETKGSESLENLARIGFVPFQVNLEDKYLKVAINPSFKTLEPGKEQTLNLELKDVENKPVKGQFTVMVVNEAILQLSGYRLPNLVDTVYAEQPISTRFSDNRPDVRLVPLAAKLPKGWGYSGGLSSALANTRIREDFQPLAYYNGAVISDDNGQANVNFTLPDDLTTWRVMVVATDDNLRFGNNVDTTFITTKPLITNAIIPQFARVGDRIYAGLSVTNTTGNSGTVNINGKLTGALQFAEKPLQTVNLKAQTESQTQAYRFPIIANKIGESQLTFTTELNNNTDGFSVPLQVKPLEVTEQVVETGVSEKSVKIPVNIDKNTSPNTGGLEIQLASTLIPEIKTSAKQVFTDEDLPFAEPAASQLLIAANLANLNQKYDQIFTELHPEKQAKQAINKLKPLQIVDGGFAAFPKQAKSDPWVSTYVAESLVTANQIFPNIVDDDSLKQLRTYLQNVLANPGQYDFCKQKICKLQLRLNALIALAELGDKRNSFLKDIYQAKDELDLVTQIKLARYLYQFPEWQNEAKIIRVQLQKDIYQTGRTAVINLPKNWSWLNSNSTIQAQTLSLFIDQKTSPETIDKLYQSLLNLRHNGTWGTSYDNAQALNALVKYSQLEPTPPNFFTSVKLANRKLGENRFQGYKNPQFNLNIPIHELPYGKNELVVEKSGKGNFHYMVAYNYRLSGNKPGRFNGLRVTREISKVNEQKPLQKIGMYTFDQPLMLKPGEVFDIGLEIITDHPVDHVVIKDPLPAGLEAVDNSFQTANLALEAKSDSWQLGYRTIYKDRIIAYSDHLETGVYNLHYLVRSVTPGTFIWPGAEVYLQYLPEEFGRSADATLEIVN